MDKGFAVVRGLYRCLRLAALTAVLPLVGVTVAGGGALFAGTWTHGRHLSWPLRTLIGAGQVLIVVVWVAAALWITHLLTSRPLAGSARRLAARWLDRDLAVTYHPPAPVTRMATGFWWDGREYHKTEREARRRSAMHARFHDPQVTGDGIWALAAGVTVFPVTVLPPLAGTAGLLAALVRPASWGAVAIPLGVVLILAGGAAAPFAWRIFRPVADRFLGPGARIRLGRRVAELETLQADLTETQAAELDRIERGLHDGAQARLVAMGMSMQAAERMVDTDPAAAKALLAETRAASRAALAELRLLVRGINPPVLVERGLVDALRALALDLPVATEVTAAVPARPERPLESALYFAVAELLTNVAKHAHARRVTVDLAHAGRTLTATVTDDGTGGAAPAPGSGLHGIQRRLAAFGGTLEIDSPIGGPTRATVSVPCVL
ncbi:Sensor protein zraS [Actinoplanes sp. SE50]|uniref:sensor histidine kinase n=1 Tax=unclassified Actinoplanes TaxID=2626549 RepID=UPI00023ECD4D|nr:MULTISPECIES: histidine kinase [unclassified Actinoplanes]AEV86588.1 Sensor protein zraS [Actinoplanes sp. SE50/110]ATO84986.1 Sensor protein zraS [Actinoplanes sp. SE50]SLM02395.1 signal transduction histidine kinase [Actinoplanes sp. SE50/110]